MRRYQQHTHASWHRAYEGKAECPWCHEGPHTEPTRPQSSAQYKRPTKRPGTSNTHRTDVTSPSSARRVEHPLKQRFDQPQSTEDQTDTQFEPHSDPAPATADDPETSTGDTADANYGKYMGRTVRHDGPNSAFASEPSRPRLPEEWTQETEEREIGSQEFNESTVEESSYAADAREHFQRPGDEKAGSLELDVRELEESEQ